MELDIWGKLWDLATAEPGDPARIEVTDEPGTVVLVWPDGSRGAFYWHDGAWQHAERGGASDAATATGMYD